MKLGRLPALIPAGLRDLTYYAAGSLPHAPQAVAVPSVTDWGMLGNDRYGDCGVAGLVHGFMADAAVAKRSEQFPSDQQTVDYYLTYTDGQDSGVVLSAFLGHVRQNGFDGHTVDAYAPVKVHDVPTLRFAIWAYDFAYTGIVVTQAMQEAFASGQPWTVETLESQVLGGHCVPAVAYDEQYVYVITWGTVQRITWAAWHYMSDEAWAVITGEFASGDGRGVSLDALKADLNRLN